jgi:hypothetical protein
MNSNNLASLSQRQPQQQPNQFESFIFNGQGVPGVAQTIEMAPSQDYQHHLQQYYHNYYNNYYQKALKNAVTSNNHNNSHHHNHGHQHNSHHGLGTPTTHHHHHHKPRNHNSANALNDMLDAELAAAFINEPTVRTTTPTGDLHNYYRHERPKSNGYFLGSSNVPPPPLPPPPQINNSGGSFITSSLNSSQFLGPASSFRYQPQMSSNTIFHPPAFSKYVTTDPYFVNQANLYPTFTIQQQQQPSIQIQPQLQLSQPGNVIYGGQNVEIVQDSLPINIEAANQSSLIQFLNNLNNNNSNNNVTISSADALLGTTQLNSGRFKLLTRNQPQNIIVDTGATQQAVNQQPQQQSFSLPTLLTGQQPATVRFTSPLVDSNMSGGNGARSVILPRIETVRLNGSTVNAYLAAQQEQQQQQPFVYTMPQGGSLISTGVSSNMVTTNDPLRRVVVTSLVNQPAATAQPLMYKL